MSPSRFRPAGHTSSLPLAGAAGIPLELALLPLFDHVLLPGTAVRVSVPAAWHMSAALMQHLMMTAGREEDAPMLVAAVPYLSQDTGGSEAVAEEVPDVDEELDWSRLHHTGVAARVMQLSRQPAGGGWTVTLEGACRVAVADVRLASQPQPFYVASVQQLDYFPGDGALRGDGGRDRRIDGEADSPEARALLRRLLAGTRRLLAAVQARAARARGSAAGASAGAGARIVQGLAEQGPARASDVVGALVARGPADRLAVLSAVGAVERLRLVLALQQRLLEVAARGPEPTPPHSTPAGEGGGGGSGGEDGGEEDGGPEDDGRAELAALMHRLRVRAGLGLCCRLR